jgi:hypothetical protein|tara:strand:- start:152 stop:517 length:366 start_codon:yes stop_codon:yes gene_type:complete
MALKPEANKFVLSSAPERHEVETSEGSLIVYVKPMSWIQQQDAMSRFVHFSMDDEGDMTPSLDLGGFWRYVLVNCITKTEPELSKDDLLNLKPEVGARLQTVLPSLTDMIEAFGGATDPLV